MARRRGARHEGARALPRVQATRARAHPTLDAEVAVHEHGRDRLECLCRYVLRPPLALDRLKLLGDDLLCIELKRAWSDGTTHVTMSPSTFLARLASLVPRPRVNTTLYYGVVAARARPPLHHPKSSTTRVHDASCDHERDERADRTKRMSPMRTAQLEPRAASAAPGRRPARARELRLGARRTTLLEFGVEAASMGPSAVIDERTIGLASWVNSLDERFQAAPQPLPPRPGERTSVGTLHVRAPTEVELLSSGMTALDHLEVVVS